MQSFVRSQNLLLSLGSRLRKMLLKTLACLKDLIVHFRPRSIVPCQQCQVLELEFQSPRGSVRFCPVRFCPVTKMRVHFYFDGS